MASDKAWQTALRFFASDGDGTHSEARVRAFAPRRDDLEHVPQNDDGLRLYAAHGDWSAVANLATKLEEAVAQRAAAVTTAHSSNNTAARQSAHVTATVARLPYVLVQVTAYMKMQRMAAAKKVLDALGDLENDDAYVHPVTRERLVPFSLRVLAALMPYYVGVATEAQGRLYALLRECEQHLADNSSSSSDDDTHVTVDGVDNDDTSNDERVATARRRRAVCALWSQRRRRVLRTLACLHTTRQQYALATQLYARAIDDDGDDRHSAKKHDNDAASRPSSLQPTTQRAAAAAAADAPTSTAAAQLRRMLQQQRLACLHLHTGDVAAAADVFARLDDKCDDGDDTAAVTSSSSSRDAVAAVRRAVRTMNNALLHVFHGRYAAAAHAWHDVAQLTSQALQTYTTTSTTTTTRPHSNGDDDDLRSLLTATLQQLWRGAQTSHLTCLVYVRADTLAPTQLLPSMVQTMEQYVRQNARALLSSEAFVENAVRVYTLCGDRKPSLEQLAQLIEVFCCEAAAIPSLDAMV